MQVLCLGILSLATTFSIMLIVRQRLAEYARKIAARRLTSGAGGNVSARDGRWAWIKPSGFAMETIAGKDMCAVDLASGRRVEGRHKPTSELPLHLAVYRARPDINAVFHTHSPWASGIISSDADIQPMFAEVVNDLGGVARVPYIIVGSHELADRVAAETGLLPLLRGRRRGALAGGGKNRRPAEISDRRAGCRVETT